VPKQERNQALPPIDRPALIVLVAVKLIVHLLTLGGYGFFRDELYYLDCGRHLGWGYVDCAPLVAVYAKIGLLLGGSLPAEENRPIFICRELIVPLPEMWPELKHWN
jgi:hypothetical protein